MLTADETSSYSPHMSKLPQPMTTNEVAARLNMQPRTVQRQAHAGLLPTVGKLPGRTGAFLFDPDAIEQIAAKLAGEVAA